MKTASAGMIAMLQNNNQFYVADLYTFTLSDGAIYRYTDADIDITANGFIFDSGSLYLKRSNIKVSTGLQVDTLTIDTFAKDGDVISSKPFLQALAQGYVDGAQIKLERAIMTTFGDTSNGVIVMFLGRVAEISFNRTGATLTVKSMIELLNIKMPRNLYQLACLHTVYDAGCTLLKSGFLTNGTVTSATSSHIVFSDIKANGYFDQGIIEFTSGANIGLKRTVKTHVTGAIDLALYLPSVPSAGDTFNIYPGCDRTQSTCTTKFSNLSHFRGYPYIPAPEAVT